jgi:Fe-S-cluster containining protein
MGEAVESPCLCSQCSGLCCRYFALPIDNPDTARDFDNIRWYLLHENVTIFVEKKQWYIGIANRCKQLKPDNRCGIYETRPKICQVYSTDNCDFHGGEYDFELLFTSAEQLERYAGEKLAKLAGKRRKGKAISRRCRPDLRKLSDRLTKQVRPRAAVHGRGFSLPLLRTPA